MQKSLFLIITQFTQMIAFLWPCVCVCMHTHAFMASPINIKLLQWLSHLQPWNWSAFQADLVNHLDHTRKNYVARWCFVGILCNFVTTVYTKWESCKIFQVNWTISFCCMLSWLNLDQFRWSTHPENALDEFLLIITSCTQGLWSKSTHKF